VPVAERIEHRPVSALIPYARNARTHSEDQVALIAGSIREFGFNNPVLVDGANGIIAGHGRVLAARKLGLEQVPVIELTFADGGYAGEKLRGAMEGHGDWTIETIRRSDAAEGFEVLPRRWVVERSFAWLGRCRRLAKDWERSIEGATAWALVASIRLMTRRLARYCYPT